MTVDSRLDCTPGRPICRHPPSLT